MTAVCGELAEGRSVGGRAPGRLPAPVSAWGHPGGAASPLDGPKGQPLKEPDEPEEEPSSGDPLPEEPLPEEPLPEEPLPDEPLPDEPVPDGPVRDRAGDEEPQRVDRGCLHIIVKLITQRGS